MTDSMTLEDVFNDEVEKPEVTGEEKGGSPTPDVKPDKVEADKPEEDSPPESAKRADDEESWTMAAVLDERRKRQELERQLEELRAKEKPEDTRPDVFEDPDGAFSHVEQRFNQKILNERITLSRALMEDRHADYADKEAVFVGMAKENPDLIRQMQEHPFPAKFAYEQASKHQEYQAMQDVDAYKSKLREEVKAELLQEMEAKNSQKAEKDKIADAPSLSKTRSAKDDPVIDESLEDIFKR